MTNRNRSALAALATLASTLTLCLVGSSPAGAVGGDDSTYVGLIPHTGGVHLPCLTKKHKSDFPCVYDAAHRGGGHGSSFRIYRDGRVKQISDRRAFGLLHGQHIHY